jgi:hypothetical protein
MSSLNTGRNTVRKRRTVFAAIAVAVATAVTVPLVADAAKKSTKPKLGASCAKRFVRSSSFICGLRNGRLIWKIADTGTNSGGGTTTGTGGGDGAVIGGATPGIPRPLDAIALVSGTPPTGAAIKVDVTCAGLASEPTQATQSASFGAQGGSQPLSFNLVEPGASNPTGSTCSAVATTTGATLRILVDGRLAGGPTADKASAAAFTPRGQSAVTVLADFGGATAATLLPTTVPGATTTTVLGATTTTLAGTGTTIAGTATTTIAPPASGKPEVATRFLGTLPAGLTGVSVQSACTSPTPGGAFQNNTANFGVTNASAVLPQTLAAATATTQATSCQITAALLGTAPGNPTLRMLLNGNAIATATGTLINTPAFPAPSAFGLVVEVSYNPPGVSSTTIAGVASTLVGAVTTTTLPATGSAANSSVTLTRTGTAPATVAGYVVTLDCVNVTVGGTLFSSYQFAPLFTTAGGTSPYAIGFQANSACGVKVTTSPTAGSTVTTGNVSVSVNGIPLTPTANGALTSGSIALAAPFTIAVTVAY